jgi:hypothetical protein
MSATSSASQEFDLVVVGGAPPRKARAGRR